MKKLLIATLLTLFTCPAFAQVVVNPTTAQWDAHDHAITTRYEFAFILNGATVPFTTINIDKASVSAIDVDTFSASIPRPILGTFFAEMRACGTAAEGGEICSDWSDASNLFKFVPKKPLTLGVR